MSSEPSPGIDPQLLDDFFAEADEHLVEIRKELLRLESSIGKAEPDLQVVKKLFQDFHSFKGISAIVGLKPAELVAHAAEDFLRLMRDGRAQLTAKGLEVLTAATHKLEQMVASFRVRKPLPGCESLLADLHEECKHWSASGAPVSPSDASFLAVEEAKSRGLLLWRFTFSPTKELDAGGVNVNSVREQLLQIGEILKATPIVKGKDTLIFEFLVSTKESPANLASWEAKGVAVEQAEPEQLELPLCAERNCLRGRNRTQSVPRLPRI